MTQRPARRALTAHLIWSCTKFLGGSLRSVRNPLSGRVECVLFDVLKSAGVAPEFWHKWGRRLRYDGHTVRVKASPTVSNCSLRTLPSAIGSTAMPRRRLAGELPSCSCGRQKGWRAMAKRNAPPDATVKNFDRLRHVWIVRLVRLRPHADRASRGNSARARVHEPKERGPRMACRSNDLR